MQGDRYANVIRPLALAAVMFLPMVSFAQAKVSDAQVEADVLKAMASNAKLANQPINTSTVFGTVTLTGSVSDEAARDEAERVASHTAGVKKVVDQLTIGVTDAAAGQQPAANGAAISAAAGSAILRSQPQADQDGGNLPPDQANGAQPYPQQQAPGQYGQDPMAQGQYPQGQYPQGQYPQQAGQYPQGQYPQGQYPQQGQYPTQQGQYPQQQGQYGDQQPGYAQGNYPPPQPTGQPPRLYRRDYERQMANAGQQPYGQPGNGGPQGYAGQQGYAAQQSYGQPGGQHVTVPDGSVLAVSINRWISSGDAAPGSSFTALVANDLVAGGQIAIPRGATVYGTVIDAKGAGALKGRGSLTLQLNSLELGGQHYPLQSDAFTVNGRDKTAQSVNSTLIGAGVGALLGAAIGRGTGAAIGAGVGGAAGLGTSAASNGGQATIPSEALLHFRLTSPVPVTTVSEAEMQRLGGYAGPAGAYRGGPGPAQYGGGYPQVGIGIYSGPYGYPYRRGYYRGGYWY